VEKSTQEKPPTEQEILAALRKQGITTLQQLAHNAAASGQALKWCLIVKGKFVYRDDAR
jgi:lambda repressor-like predicted transcriptional regulator